MREKEVAAAAGELAAMIPILQQKLIKPFEHLARSSISPMQFHVLVVLEEAGALGMTHLARGLLTSKQQMTPIVDKLMNLGYVQRIHDDADRRIVKISLSTTGREFLENLKLGIVEMFKEKIMPLKPADLSILRGAIRDIGRIVDTLP